MHVPDVTKAVGLHLDSTQPHVPSKAQQQYADRIAKRPVWQSVEGEDGAAGVLYTLGMTPCVKKQKHSAAGRAPSVSPFRDVLALTAQPPAKRAKMADGKAGKNQKAQSKTNNKGKAAVSTRVLRRGMRCGRLRKWAVAGRCL